MRKVAAALPTLIGKAFSCKARHLMLIIHPFDVKTTRVVQQSAHQDDIEFSQAPLMLHVDPFAEVGANTTKMSRTTKECLISKVPTGLVVLDVD